MPHPTPHADHLTVGKRIHRNQQPRCCSRPMGYYGALDLSAWECATFHREIYTNTAGDIEHLTQEDP